MTEEQAPEGYKWEWVPEDTLTGALDWDTLLESEAKRCRYIKAGVRCDQKSAVRLNRSCTPGYEQWWHYCDQHMFGRRLSPSGVVETRILREVES